MSTLPPAQRSCSQAAPTWPLALWMGGLAAACELLPARGGDALRMALLAEAHSGSFSGSRILQPLRWVGYELSAYCVAKTLVILEMMEQGAAVDDILQVTVAAVCAGYQQASDMTGLGFVNAMAFLVK